MDNCPELQRLAFGAVLLQPVEDRISGYSLLDAYLPTVNLDGEGSQGFLYQINRPRRGAIEDQPINRLCKWSVQTRTIAGMMIEGQGIQPLPSGAHTSMSCRLELDINTNGDFTGKFSGEKALEVLRILRDFAIEIATEGDKP